MKKSSSAGRGFIRIIGGSHRGCRICFTPSPRLRPTPSGVRETLFNWIQQDIAHTHCLDLFAGTAALGVEALSRGADFCTFVEYSRQYCRQIEQYIQKFDLQRKATIIHADAFAFLRRSKTAFDIVFLDPPFNANMAAQAISLLESCEYPHKLPYVYFEIGKREHLPLSHKWQIMRQNKAGDVQFGIICPQPAPQS